MLVTDLAHGWIPPGIALPAGVRLLAPGRRTGRAAALLGETTARRTYAPGDPLARAARLRGDDASAHPVNCRAVEDLGWSLGQATHWRTNCRGWSTRWPRRAPRERASSMRRSTCCACIWIPRATRSSAVSRTSIPRCCSTACCWLPPKPSSPATRSRRTTTWPGSRN